MDIRPLSDRYAVSPQIAPDDAEEIAAAGYRTVVCNRPDAEVPPELQSAAVGEAMRAAGLSFVVLPLTHDTLRGRVAEHRAAIGEGPTLAYCASGTRSTIVWALGEAPETGADGVIEAAARVGYDLSTLRPELES